MSTADCGGKRGFPGETEKDIYSLPYEETESVFIPMQSILQNSNKRLENWKPRQKNNSGRSQRLSRRKNRSSLLRDYVPGIRENRSIGSD